MSPLDGVRVGMISQWFAPERGSAGFATVIARQLQSLGARLRVITGLPNYPTGEIYPGYRMRLPYADQIDGVLVRRVPLYPAHDPSALPRMANYLSFAASATFDALRRFGDREVVLVHGTPATAAIPAMALRALRGIPFVLHVQDLWPDTVTASGFIGGAKGRIAENVLHHFCDLSYRLASHIAVTSPGMVDAIHARGVPLSKLSVVTNWADESIFTPTERDAGLAAQLGITRPFNLLYAGNLGPLQELSTLLDAAEALRDEPQIGVVLVGEGTDRARLQADAKRRGLDNVVFVPPQPMNEMRSIMALGDIHYVGLSDQPLFRTTMPSKLQATLAAGRPVIAVLKGDAAAAIEQASAGAVVEVGNGAGLARIAKEWFADPAKLTELATNARAYYQTHFSSMVSGSALAQRLADAARTGRKNQ